MAEDDVISAMWSSLVSTVECGDGAEDVELATNYTIWNPHEMVMAGAEPEIEMEVQERIQHLQGQDILPMVYWNQPEPVHNYQQAEEFLISMGTAETLLHNYMQAQNVLALEPKRISKVPDAMRKANAEYSYDPRAMSVGPYHHGLRNLPLMDKYKRHFLQIILSLNPKISERQYKQRIRDAEPRVRNYYAEPINMRSKQLAESLLLDACFLLGCFGILQVQSHKGQKVSQAAAVVLPELNTTPEAEEKQLFPYFPFVSSENNGIRDLPLIQTWDFIHDIILMENQIPFFVIELIYDLAMDKNKQVSVPLRSQIVECLRDKILRHYPTSVPTDHSVISAVQPFEHILHYCHMHFKPTISAVHDHGSTSQSTTSKRGTNHIHRATDLYEAGIKIEKLEGDGVSLVDIKFNNGVLQIPVIVVDYKIWPLFSNMIAFEQSCYRPNSSNLSSNYFTAYVKFLDNLMTTTEDVSLLARKSIIKNHLGKNDAVVYFFNKLVKEVNLHLDEANYLSSVCEDLENHYESRLKKWMADLRKKYFQNPWLIIGAVAGAIIFLFTVMQGVLALIRTTS